MKIRHIQLYLMTLLKSPEYIRINLRDIPDETIEEYKLKEKQAQKVLYISSPTTKCMSYHNRDYFPTSYLKTTEQTRQPTEKTSTQTLETQMATYTVHTSGRQVRPKIRGKRSFTPPKTNTRGKLQIYNRVGQHKVYRNHARLGS